jgi:hypothetical protein
MHSLTHSTLVPLEDAIEEVSVNHPEVVSILEETLKRSKDVNFEQPYEKYAEILDEVLKEVRTTTTKKTQPISFYHLLKN